MVNDRPSESLQELLARVRACRLCAEHLPYGPRPVLQMSRTAKILIAGQAPGKKVHESGLPFDDASGDRLRDWLGLPRDEFYDPALLAIVPMGFCFPGTGKSGDLPPRRECAPAWREELLARLPRLELTLAIGKYALACHLPAERGSLTVTVQDWERHWPDVMPLPHPSPRNNGWLKRNPWFEQDLIPVLQARVVEILSRAKGLV